MPNRVPSYCGMAGLPKRGCMSASLSVSADPARERREAKRRPLARAASFSPCFHQRPCGFPCPGGKRCCRYGRHQGYRVARLPHHDRPAHSARNDRCHPLPSGGTSDNLPGRDLLAVFSRERRVERAGRRLLPSDRSLRSARDSKACQASRWIPVDRRPPSARSGNRRWFSVVAGRLLRAAGRPPEGLTQPRDVGNVEAVQGLQ